MSINTKEVAIFNCAERAKLDQLSKLIISLENMK